jgi:multiple sugar transport system substrate-binding protein
MTSEEKRKMNKRVLWILVTVLVLAALAACAPAPTPAPTAAPPTAAPAAPTTAPAAPTTAAAAPTTAPATTKAPALSGKITVWVYDSFAKDNTAPIYAVAKKFMDQNPGVTVEIVPTPTGSGPFRDKFITAAHAGGGPDAIMLDIAWSAQLSAAQLLLPLDTLAAKDVANFYPGPVDTCKYQGKLYCLPWYTNALAMFYNKTAFTAAGLPLPKDGWTWDDFTKAAKTLTKGNMYGFGYEGGFGGTFEFFPWLWQNGGTALTPDGKKAAFNTPEGIEAVDTFLGLVTKDKVVPEAAKSWKSWDQLAAAFSQQVIAMYEVGDWGLAGVDAQKPTFEWGVAPLPKKKTQASIVGGANWGVNAKSKQADLAYAWVQFVTGPDVFAMMDGYQRTAARSTGGTQKIVTGDPRMQAFVDTFKYAKWRDNIPNWTSFEYDCLQPEFSKITLEGKDVKKAMSDAEVCTNTALSK